MVVLLVSLIISPRFVWTVLMRTLKPWADIPPASLIAFQVEPGDWTVLQGEPVTVKVNIEGGDLEEIELRVTDGEGSVRRFPLSASRPAGSSIRLPACKRRSNTAYMGVEPGLVRSHSKRWSGRRLPTCGRSSIRRRISSARSRWNSP